MQSQQPARPPRAIPRHPSKGAREVLAEAQSRVGPSRPAVPAAGAAEPLNAVPAGAGPGRPGGLASANLEIRNPWEAKKMQILPVPLSLTSPLSPSPTPCRPAASSPTDCPQGCPLSSQTRTKENSVSSVTLLGKSPGRTLCPPLKGVVESVSVWLRVSISGHNLKSPAFPFTPSLFSHVFTL